MNSTLQGVRGFAVPAVDVLTTILLVDCDTASALPHHFRGSTATERVARPATVPAAHERTQDGGRVRARLGEGDATRRHLRRVDAEGVIHTAES